MTVSTSYVPLTYTGNGVTTAFPVTWQFFSGTLVVTEIVIATGVETVKTINTHYTVTGGTGVDGLPATGQVVALSAPADTVRWQIERATPKTQGTTWGENDAFPQKTIEAALDRQMLIAQEGLGSEMTGVMRLVTAGEPDYWDADDEIIRNVADPVEDDDAVSKGYADANYGGAAAVAAAASASAASNSASAASASALSAASSATQATNASGFLFTFDSSTTMADPGTGDVRFNNSSFASVTAIAVSDSSANTGNPDVSASVLSWDDSTSVNSRGILTFRKASAPQNFAEFKISGTSTDNSGWTQLAVTHVTSNGTLSGGDTLVVSFTRTGDKGDSGEGSGDLLSTENLNDLADKSIARTNLGVAIGTNVQAFDADLSALAALNSTGLAARTASNTWAQRTLQAPAAGITITNPAGVAGDPTFALANDLAALEGLSTNGLVTRTSDGNATTRTITGTSNEITVTNGDGVSGNPTLALHSGVYRASGTDVPVADGGTGVSSLTAYAPIFGGTTSTGALQSGTVGTLGQVLTSNGAGSLPTFQAPTGGADIDLLATLTTTSGTTQSVTGLPASEMFLIGIIGVSAGGSPSGSVLQVAVSSNGGSSYGSVRAIAAGLSAAASTVNGAVQIVGTGSTQNKMVSPLTIMGTTIYVTTSVETSVTGVIDALRFSWSGGESFDAGTIYIYGLS